MSPRGFFVFGGECVIMFERFRTRLRRRGFLGSVAGATAALAGCETLEFDTSETTTNTDSGPMRDREANDLHPPPVYGLGVRGARHPAWLVRLCREDCTTTTASFETVGERLTYGLVPAPAGTVPVVRVVVALQNDTQGEHTAFGLTTSGRRERDLDPLVAGRTDGSTAVNRLYDEVYLNEVRFGTSYKNSLGDATLEPRLRVTGGTGTLRSESTVALVYEVLDGDTGDGQPLRERGGEE